MELHILIRELNGEQKRGTVIYSQAEPVPFGMTRNHCLHWMLAKIKEVFPVEDKPSPYDQAR